MRLKTVLKLAVAAVVIFVGVKFGVVYANRLQFKSVLSAEALDARRDRIDADGLVRRINARARLENLTLPEDMAFDVAGLDDPSKDLVITANYTEVVDLKVKKFPLKMTVVARADAPATH
jgi:hypothetical protein